MSAYVHLIPEASIVWMRRNLVDIVASQERIDWQKHEPLEHAKYFSNGAEHAAIVKTRAWEDFQRIALAERAYDRDYESLSGHPLWVEKAERKNFAERQTQH